MFFFFFCPFDSTQIMPIAREINHFAYCFGIITDSTNMDDTFIHRSVPV
jgi:hypothetical protein